MNVAASAWAHLLLDFMTKSFRSVEKSLCHDCMSRMATVQELWWNASSLADSCLTIG